MKMLLQSGLALLFACSIVPAQATSGRNEISVWGGYSPDSTTAIKAFGRTPDTRFGLVALRYVRRFNNGSAVNLKYTADLIPVAVMNFPDLATLAVTRKTAYAIGVTPFGIQANFRPAKKYQPFVDLSGGFMYFNKQVPNALGTKFHFTAALGGGVEIRTKKNRAVTLGYKYYHVSNGQRGEINPGFDNNLFYIGYTFFSK
jgi:hypothetical protein